jgi:hypothetical protein
LTVLKSRISRLFGEKPQKHSKKTAKTKIGLAFLAFPLTQ